MPCPPPVERTTAWWLTATAALALAGCGGGSTPASGPQATHSVTAGVMARPVFHMAPVELAEPPMSPADVEEGSEAARPTEVLLPAHALQVDTAGLSPARLQAALRRAQAQSAGGSTGLAQPMGNSARVFNPGQIRGAYGLPALASAPASQLGAGQTIYIVIAYHNATIEADLAAFSERFGLPGCSREAIDPGASLPLGPASADGCSFSVVHATAGGGMTGDAPAVNDQWASESALDVQWAHAVAPMARIVLIEAGDASIDALLGAVSLANRMGPGVVSMSWGTDEGSWTASVDDRFSTPGMTYLAATGDDGVNVSWPAVSPRVIAVGGTTLTWTGNGARREVAWSRTGGGISAYTEVAKVQAGTRVNGRALARRAVADVAFNADPYSGQYVALTDSASGTLQWRSFGGTSISAPQWAGLLAVASAVRAARGAAPGVSYLGILYRRIASDAGGYARAFSDVASGRNGGCGACASVRGYDIPTGWGTPHFGGLMPQLSAAYPPAAVAALAQGSSGKAYAQKVPVSDLINGDYSITVDGAPDGLQLGEDGTLGWESPVPGRYDLSLHITAASGATLSVTRTLVMLAAPELPGGEWTAVRRRAFSRALAVASEATGPLTYALQGAPRGMAIGPKGLVSWAAPVAGTYSFTVVARNAAGGVGRGSYTLTVN